MKTHVLESSAYLNKTPLQGFPMDIEKFLKNTYFE